MLTVWEQRTSVGNSEDQLKLNLPINEGLGEGNLTEQYDAGQRRCRRSAQGRFKVIPPINVRYVEANANCIGAKTASQKF